MKQQSALNWLVPLIIIFSIITSGVGLFAQYGDGPFAFTTVHGDIVEMYGRGLYSNDSLFAGALFRGTDAFILFAALPLLLAGYLLHRRGSLRGSIVMIGTLFCFLYNSTSLLFSAAFNSMFLMYAASFSASLFAVIIALTTFDAQLLAGRVASGFPHRGIAVFMFVAGLGTLFLWVSELIGPLTTGQAPANLGPYTTMFTHGFDSAVITPTAVVTGIYLLRRKSLGYLLAAPMMILCALIGVAVIAQTISQSLVGIVFPIGVYIGMVGSWVVMGAFAIALTISFFRNLR